MTNYNPVVLAGKALQMKRIAGFLLAACAFFTAAPGWAGGGPPNDTFDDANTGGWQVGPPHPAPPAITSNCGDTGAGDSCLVIQSLNIAGGPGSRLGIFNSSGPWTGDYNAANITAIRLFARNSGFQDLTLRLRLQGPGGNFITTSALTLPTGSGQTFEFSLAPENLTPFDPTNAAVTLGNVTRVWLYHSVLAEFPPPVGPYEVELDDIAAVAGGGPAPQAPISVPAMNTAGFLLLLLLVGLLGSRLSRRAGASE